MPSQFGAKIDRLLHEKKMRAEEKIADIVSPERKELQTSNVKEVKVTFKKKRHFEK